MMKPIANKTNFRLVLKIFCTAVDKDLICIENRNFNFFILL
jgi:hypothetical protein